MDGPRDRWLSLRSSAFDAKRQGEEQGRWERFSRSRQSTQPRRLSAGAETEAVVSAHATRMRHEADLGDLGLHWPL